MIGGSGILILAAAVLETTANKLSLRALIILLAIVSKSLIDLQTCVRTARPDHYHKLTLAKANTSNWRAGCLTTGQVSAVIAEFVSRLFPE